MSKRTPFLFFIILIVSTMPLSRAEALGMGPPSFELDLQMDGSNSTTVYVTSDGLTGELIVGKETLPFRIEPSRINMSSSDVNVPVELTFYGNETLEPGVYEGKVTFLAYTGGFVAMGIKIRAKINLLAEAQEIQIEEPEHENETVVIHIQEPSGETGHDINVLEPEPDEEEESEEEMESEDESESEEEPRAREPADESQDSSIIPYIMGGMIGVALAALGFIVWWKRR